MSAPMMRSLRSAELSGSVRAGAEMADRGMARNGNRARPASRRHGRAQTRRNGIRTPPDVGILHEHLGYFVRRLQVAVFQDFIRTLAPVDLRPAQYSVLVVISANPGLSQADLAAALGIERARLVHLLDRLERRGLIRRLAS